MKAELNIDTKELEERITEKVISTLLPHLNGNIDNDVIFDVEGLAEYLKVGTQWVYENRDIPYFKIGKYKRFRKSKVDQWLDNFERGSSKKQTIPVRRQLEDTPKTLASKGFKN